MELEQEVESGWIVAARNDGLGVDENNYLGVYTSSIYFVITSFSSVGYGDIKAQTHDER